MTLHEGIRASYLAENLSASQVEALAALATERKFEDGEVVVAADDDNADLYVVLEGKVEVLGAGDEFIARLKPGGVFGEVALVDEGKRSASVVASGSCVLAMIPSATLETLFHDQPALAAMLLRNIGRILSQRLRSANLQLEALLLGLG